MKNMSRSMITAMLCAAAVTALFVGGKATRDALFLTSLNFTALPTMLMATSVCSILLVALYSRAAGRITPATLVPASFVASGILFVAEWLFRSHAPATSAIIVYLHISGAGPLLASGFWLIATERFDPRAAKKSFGQIAGAGTLGGLLGALLSERVAALLGVPAMLLVLAVVSFLTAWLVSIFARSEESLSQVPPLEEIRAEASPRSGLRVVAEAPHLRQLAMLVVLGTTSAALLDYLFKAKAVEVFGPGDNLLRFFALFYAVTSLITFVLQTWGSRTALERFGVALTTSTPSIALLAGSVGSLVAPGLGGLIVARGGESTFRGSWFRAGYELFFTPISAAEKRAAKSVIDVAFDRLGDAVGGGLVRLVVVFGPVAQSSTILSLAMATSIGAILASSHLNRWYLRTLEKSLVNQGGGIDLAVTQGLTRTGLVSIGRREVARRAVPPTAATRTTASRKPNAGVGGALKLVSVDLEVQDILSLRSRNVDRAMDVLSRPDKLTPGLVPHVIALLAVDPVADHALTALRKVAEERVGQLVDALLDQDQDYAVRRRLARVFSVSVSQRAVDGLLLALDDPRFDVRFQSARSLAAILDRNPRIHIDRDRILDVVLREVTVGRPVWESRRLLDGFVSKSPLDEFVRDRAGHSLAHVFTLLSLVLPREPLQIAFRSLHSNDRHLQGTALEYLEEVLPAPVRQRLWPFLLARPAGGASAGPARRHDDIIADLLRSSQSITLRNIAKGWEKQQAAGFRPV